MLNDLSADSLTFFKMLKQVMTWVALLADVILCHDEDNLVQWLIG